MSEMNGQQGPVEAASRSSAGLGGAGYIVAIRKNSTGEIRLRQVGFPWDDGSEWYWSEGNMSCDCNRFLEFERAGGYDPYSEDPRPETECGDVAYSVLYAELPSGERVVIDDDA